MYEDFDPKSIYAGYVMVATPVTPETVLRCVEMLDEQIKLYIPPDCRSRIRYTIENFTDLNRPGADPLSRLGRAMWEYLPQGGGGRG